MPGLCATFARVRRKKCIWQATTNTSIIAGAIGSLSLPMLVTTCSYSGVLNHSLWIIC